MFTLIEYMEDSGTALKLSSYLDCADQFGFHSLLALLLWTVLTRSPLRDIRTSFCGVTWK